MFRRIYEKFIRLDYAELIIKIFLTLILASLFGWLRFYVVDIFKADSILHYTLDIVVVIVLIYSMWRSAFYYKQYKGNQLAGLYQWDDHSNPERVKNTEKRMAYAIKNADNVDMLLSSGLHTFKKRSCRGLSLKDAISETHACVRVLLLDPHNKDICDKRLSRMNPDAEITLDSFREGIKETIAFIESLQNDGRNVHYRLYNEIPVFRIVRIDQVLQIQPYVKWQMSREAACLGFSSLIEFPRSASYFQNNKTSLYIPFFNYFEELFERSQVNKRLELRYDSENNVGICYNGAEASVQTIDKSDNGLRIYCDNGSCFCIDREFREGEQNITIMEDSHKSSGVIKWSKKTDNLCYFGIKKIN